METSLPIYLDYAAATPLDPRVVESICGVLASPSLQANPASLHRYGFMARERVEEARAKVAGLIEAEPEAIFWTSGATEANNLAIKGAAYFYADKGRRHIITLETEHKSVLETCLALKREGFSLTVLRPEPNGLLDLEALRAALRDDTLLVSIMQANNETGVIQDLDAIAALVKEKGAFLHVDAAQSIGKVGLNVQAIPLDFVSLSASKVYGPKGIGALYVRRKPRARLRPLLHGGGQEQGLRAGTLAIHQIVGMGEAFALAQAEFQKDEAHVLALRHLLLKGLADIPGLIFNGCLEHSVPGIVNISCQGVDGESLFLALEPTLAVSSGSACTGADVQASHVLLALGVPDHLAHSALRLSFGRFTTQADITAAITIVSRELHRLRELGSPWQTI